MFKIIKYLFLIILLVGNYILLDYLYLDNLYFFISGALLTGIYLSLIKE